MSLIDNRVMGSRKLIERINRIHLTSTTNQMREKNNDLKIMFRLEALLPISATKRRGQ
jgi:hypothetical protein